MENGLVHAMSSAGEGTSDGELRIDIDEPQSEGEARAPSPKRPMRSFKNAFEKIMARESEAGQSVVLANRQKRVETVDKEKAEQVLQKAITEERRERLAKGHVKPMPNSHPDEERLRKLAEQGVAQFLNVLSRAQFSKKAEAREAREKLKAARKKKFDEFETQTVLWDVAREVADFEEMGRELQADRGAR